MFSFSELMPINDASVALDNTKANAGVLVSVGSSDPWFSRLPNVRPERFTTSATVLAGSGQARLEISGIHGPAVDSRCSHQR
jgi:hypothetical protein